MSMKADTVESGSASIPKFNFTISPSLTPYNLPATQWLTTNNKHWDGLATGCTVFNHSKHILLVQRAAHDSMPGKWEIPGGAVDDEDPSLFAGAARELWEEAGLLATKFTHVVPQVEGGDPAYVYGNSKGTRIWCRFCFVVEVEEGSWERVKLDPNEHQDYVWVSEEDVRGQRVGERDLPITTEAMRGTVLEAFRLRQIGDEGS